MQQVLQSLKNGATSLEDVPCPSLSQDSLLIRSQASLISAGTERMLLDFGKAGWIAKARQQPDKLAMLFEKFRADGAVATVEAVRAKLDHPIPLGYSNAGIVLRVGPGVKEFLPGDRVASNGPHAGVVVVSKNLCAKIPDAVSDDEGAFTVVGAIALQALRLAQPNMGECVVVSGLGLIGLITVQLLLSHGCRVVGVDVDGGRCELARSWGAEAVNLSDGQDAVLQATKVSRGRGVDAVIIAASTRSSEPVRQAALMCRKRGRIVLVGVTGIDIRRDEFYKKELTFQVSCSYGPGRYDAKYESGQDYPVPFVRWTAQRNLEAILDMIAGGRLRVKPLITHRFLFDHALDAYNLLNGNKSCLGVLLQYQEGKRDDELLKRRVILHEDRPSQLNSNACIGFIGAGSYAAKVLIPAFRKTNAELAVIASNGGISAAHAGRKFGFAEATTDVDAIIANPRINTIAIATRHDSHAALVCRALNGQKHVFVEKPLALDGRQIDEIEQTWNALSEPRLLMVGFNRRFSPHVARMKELLKTVKEPKAFVYTVNAGAIPAEHWTQDLATGGGRILGEACHFIDLLRFLASCPAKTVQTARQSSDTVTITITYEDGSIGTIHYFATGHKSLSKERLEIFAAGRVLILDNFRCLQGHGWPGFRKMKLWQQNKGAMEMAAAFVNAIRSGGPPPIPIDELIEVSRTTIEAASA
jgi:predicted dehydrogenase/threonine dehydrogenase-like Zn-dependent dehydrogenase